MKLHVFLAINSQIKGMGSMKLHSGILIYINCHEAASQNFYSVFLTLCLMKKLVWLCVTLQLAAYALSNESCISRWNAAGAFRALARPWWVKLTLLLSQLLHCNTIIFYKTWMSLFSSCRTMNKNFMKSC